MCGIAGIVTLAGNVPREALGAMTEAIRHRGPDTSGAWSDGLCALGHRRLSIIDLSMAGRQPLSNEDGTLWITFNGEIYNFQALRQELEGLGHRFRTRTDTEVIVHAYEQWDTDCVKRLRGMFAFGIWDQRRRRLFAARDRIGKKPLFYIRQPDRFLFASELQGLLAGPGVPREVDLAGLDAYLSWGYVPAPQTAFRGIEKLPPGHWLTLDLVQDGPRRGSAALHVERYWSLPYDPKLSLSEDEAAEALRDRLTEAVRQRMISDVPLGAFLSGGIDSSIVVGLMALLSDRPVNTFSIGFEEAGFNELQHARRVADRWRTEHHELVVRPDALAILPKLVRHYGEPFDDPCAVPAYYVSQLTRASVTVALNGDGGDESFAGYLPYRRHQLAERIRRMPGSATAALRLVRLLPDSIDGGRLLRQSRGPLLAIAHDQARRHVRWASVFREEAKIRLYSGDLRAQFAGTRPCDWMESLYADTVGLDPAEAAMAVGVRSRLPYSLLVKMDIASMANSLEARSPFLDHEVMELAARLPAHLKLRRGNAKYLLKRAFADLLPPENLSRRKMGFNVPVEQWLRGPLRELLCDSLFSRQSLSRGYFQASEIKRLVTQHVDRHANHALQLWNLLMLELWFQEMLDRSASSRTPRPCEPAPSANQVQVAR